MSPRQKSSSNSQAKFEKVATRLTELYAFEEAEIWLASRQPLLGGQIPAELVQAGKVDEVLHAIDQLADGVYL